MRVHTALGQSKLCGVQKLLEVRYQNSHISIRGLRPSARSCVPIFNAARIESHCAEAMTEGTNTPRLPTELRLMVWNLYALPRGPVTHVFELNLHGHLSSVDTGCLPDPDAFDVIRNLMQVNQEARHEVLQGRELVKPVNPSQWPLKIWFPSDGSTPPGWLSQGYMFVNWELDLISLEGSRPRSIGPLFFDAIFLSKVRFLAVGSCPTMFLDNICSSSTSLQRLYKRIDLPWQPIAPDICIHRCSPSSICISLPICATDIEPHDFELDDDAINLLSRFHQRTLGCSNQDMLDANSRSPEMLWLSSYKHLP
ncbi:hypothetical protein F4780DRAFT_736305 [Xylariomycetidae sp. FL0641]|nr:hypothetical protein F4780DRAFT_736305 [Xylariomycetidae sp. FL0641]